MNATNHDQLQQLKAILERALAEVEELDNQATVGAGYHTAVAKRMLEYQKFDIEKELRI